MFGIKYRYFAILLLTVYSYFNILFTLGESALSVQYHGIYLFLALGLTVLFIWEFNRGAESVLRYFHRKKRLTLHPLVTLFTASLGVVIVASLLSLVLLDLILKMPVEADYTHSKLLLAFGFRVNLFLQCINAIVFFMDQYRKVQLEAVQLRKITVEAQFEALRNQVNPHFMFNCFSVLSTLVYRDPVSASKFIAQIAIVYRYLLNSQAQKLVTLGEELTFVESYLYLQQIRFGENLVIEQNVSANPDDFYVAPASLQMLIENAIKHNVVSKSNPLTISLYTTQQAIVITNNLQEKPVKDEQSTHRGLENIQSRYRLLSDVPVVIERTATEFKVAIPLLQVEK